MNLLHIYLLTSLVSLFACQANDNITKPEVIIPTTPYAGDLPINQITLRPGFKMDVFAENVENARSLCLSPSGTLFVGTRSKGSVYALVDTDQDGRADQKYTLATGLQLPNGVAFRDGDLYVAEVSRVIRYEDIENNLENPPVPTVIFEGYPEATHHGWKYIAFGPDGKLYVPVGAPCNVCDEEDPVFATITRLNPDGTDMEIVQEGIRNTVGFTWHPETDELWFTDNGRDWLGDDSPACELNYAPEDGLHFGFPYCHQGDMPDPEFGDVNSCAQYRAPARNLGPHVAPLGLEFYKGQQFPERYRHQVFIAEHGSWNRSVPIGYRIMQVDIENTTTATSYKPFATGWLQGDEAWGRPVDLEHLPDGSLLVSDDFADAIYRIYYVGD